MINGKGKIKKKIKRRRRISGSSNFP